MKVAKDHVVLFDYEVRNGNADLLDTSKDSGPMGYIHGYANIIPGLEKALEGKQAGDEVNVVVFPDEAYGQRDESRVAEVSRSIFAPGTDIQPGMRFQAQSPQGTDTVFVVSVSNETVVVDANHPLAGETLTFEVKIVDVRPATESELAHGHVHHGDDHHSHDHDHGHGGCCSDHGGCGCH